jgi:telomere length regulation protein
MLVAEVVAQHTDKKLDFGGWDGDEIVNVWARELRVLITARDVDADTKIEDEDDNSSPMSGTTAIPTVTGDAGLPAAPIPHASYDSDDSLTGYASPSSRSASPTQSELEEVEQDPTLRVGVKKIPRPVYLIQLGELVRNTSGLKSDETEQEADKVEMALNCGEQLIRQKQNYGVELGTLQEV